jgi:hypothetical protein
MSTKHVPNVPAGTGLYPVIDVDGRLPAMPTDFIGASRIIVAVAGKPRRLDGAGNLTDRGLEFRQNVTDGTKAAIWAIAEDGNQNFWAQPPRPS